MADIRIAYCLTLYDALNSILFTEPEEGKMPLERKIPFKTKYKIQKNLNVLAKDYVYYEEERTSLIKEYGEESEGKITVKPENMTVFKEEIGKILSMEVQRDFLKFTDEEMEEISGDIIIDCAAMELIIQYLTD